MGVIALALLKSYAGRLAKLPVRTLAIVFGGVLLVALVWYVHWSHGRDVRDAERRGADRVTAAADRRSAEYTGAISVLAVQLRAAQNKLAATTKRVDVQLPKTKRALTAVTPAERNSSPVAVQVALAEADSLIPLLEEFRVQVQTVTSAAAAVHTLDSTALHAAHVVIGTVTFQRDSAITASNAKVTKTKAFAVGSLFAGAVGVVSYFFGRATR